MKLWLLDRLDKLRPEWDCADGFVIRAETEEAARKLASAHPGDEGAAVWLSLEQSSCVELAVDGGPDIILTDYCRG